MRLARKTGYMAWIALPVVYVILVVTFPVYWAIATAVVFVIASGLFTSKIVLGIESPKAIIGLSPVFGIGWLLFLWLLFGLAG